MDNVRLIFEVSKHEELFDTKNKYYFDSENRHRLWIEISKILNSTPEICKNRWRNLRTSFVNELRKTAKNPMNSTGRKYMYYEQMLFLLPYVLHRRGNADEIFQNEVEVNYSEHDFELSDNPIPETFIPEDSKEYIDIQPALIEPSLHQRVSVQKDLVNSHIHSNRMNNEKIERRTTLRTPSCDYQIEDIDDPLKHFFMTMYKTVKKFPIHLQIATKRTIFMDVTNIEEKMQNHLPYNHNEPETL